MYELTYWAFQNGQGSFKKRDVNMTEQTLGVLEGRHASKFASFVVDDGEMMYIPINNINEVLEKRGDIYEMEYRNESVDERGD